MCLDQLACDPDAIAGPHGLYRAGELDQEAVAGSFNDSTLVLIKLSPSEKWTLQKVAEGRVSR